MITLPIVYTAALQDAITATCTAADATLLDVTLRHTGVSVHLADTAALERVADLLEVAVVHAFGEYAACTEMHGAPVMFHAEGPVPS